MGITYDKKILIILRAALIVLGGVIGGVCVWQYFEYYPIIKREFQIVVIVVSALALAALLGLSAKAFYRFGSSVKASVGNVADDLGANGIIAVALAPIAAAAVAYLLDRILLYYNVITSVRIIADVVTALAATGIFAYAFTKWISAPSPDLGAVKKREAVGYLLTADCFTDDRVFVAADVLNNVCAADGVFEAVTRLYDEAAAIRLKRVAESGKVKFVKASKCFTNADEYAAAEKNAAERKRLKTVGFVGADVGIENFSINNR